MIAILIVIGLVALVSLYDYFSTRSWQQVTSTVRNETVFEKRNKKYGAFVIRRDYNRNMILIMLGIVGGVGVIYAAASATKGHVKAVVKPPVVMDTTVFDLKKEPEPVKPEVELPKLKTPSPEEIVKFVPPVVVNNPAVPDPPIVDPGVGVGVTPQPPGPGTGWTEPGEPGDPAGPILTGGGTPPPPTYDVDEPAEFPGGREAMKDFLSKNLKYPELDAQEGNGGKCYLRFVVNKQGEISEVKVTRAIESCPDCDKEAIRIVRKMPRWKPGKKKGEPVDSYFNLPITFKPG